MSECWFLQCDREPAGTLHGSNGFAVTACEKHGVKGESFGWEKFEPYSNQTPA